MTPDAILPVASFAAGGLCLAAAFLVGYIAEKAQDCLRRAFYATLSAGFTILGAAVMFGHMIAHFTHR